jgi:DNA-3-methyladenine glycosylase II
MPALRRREPGYAGLAAIICGQQLSTASAAAIWAPRQRRVRSVSP